MIHMICDRCGGKWQLAENRKEAVCPACGRRIAVPQGYTEAESELLFANEERLRGNYEKAEGAFREIIRRRPECAAAYWGAALSRYQTEYQPLSDGSYRLICHQAGLTQFASDPDVQNALRKSSGAEQASYVEEARQIQALQKAAADYAARYEGCNVLLLANPSDARGMAYASKLSQVFGASQWRTFCPAATLRNVPLSDREPALFHAFSTADVCIVAAGSPEAFDAETVFDAERFLGRRARARRAAEDFIPKMYLFFGNLDEYEDIPDTLYRGFDDRINAAVRGCGETIENLVRQAIESHRSDLLAASRENRGQTYANLIGQGLMSLKTGEFEKAEKIFNRVLDINASEGQAYWGLLLCERKAKTNDELIQSGKPIREENNYRNALAFGSPNEQKIYRETADAVDREGARLEVLQQERLAKEAEEAQKREKASAEIQAARQRQQQQAIRDAHKSNAGRKGLVAVIAVLLILGGSGYLWYNAHGGADARLYREASDYYSERSYSLAKEIYEQLAEKGYRDSEAMVSACDAALQLERFYEAKASAEHDFSLRPGAVNTLRWIRENVPEADVLLDEWKAEGYEEYAAGRYVNAWYALLSYGELTPEYLTAWRIAASRQCADLSDYGDVAGISRSDASLVWGNTDLEFEGGAARSVDISPDGGSAVVVRADGTVSLVGRIAKTADVSGWTDIVYAQTDGSHIYGLREDGVLISSAFGEIAGDIVSFDSAGQSVAAVHRDGTVYAFDIASSEIVSSWTDVRMIATNGKVTLAVNGENKLLEVNADSIADAEEVGVVYADGSRCGFVHLNGKGVSLEKSVLIDRMYMGYAAAKTILRMDMAGGVSALTYEASIENGNFQKALRKFPSLGPCPEESWR